MALPKLKITYTFMDESEQEIVTRLFRCNADEIAYERRYGYPLTARLMVGVRQMRAAGEDPEARMDALAGMEFEDRAAMMRSEDTAFFAWCVWARDAAANGKPQEDFDAWVQTVAALDIDVLEKPEAPGVDPTTAALPA